MLSTQDLVILFVVFVVVGYNGRKPISFGNSTDYIMISVNICCWSKVIIIMIVWLKSLLERDSKKNTERSQHLKPIHLIIIVVQIALKVVRKVQLKIQMNAKYAWLTNTVFIPCDHVVACGKCASTFRNCPMCRKEIGNIIRIYFL